MRLAVVGATGYVGAEVVRWALGWPAVELVAVTSRRQAGKLLSDAVPALLGFTGLRLQTVDALPSELDAVVLAVPHGAAAPLVPDLAHVPVIVDCSRDHRHVPGWVYGQPEWNGEALPGAARIAAPGCFATAISLGLAPLVAAGVVVGPARVVAATGSTGSGVAPSRAAHHPERHVNLRPYKVLQHQHVPEIRGLLAQLGSAPRIDFVPWSAPIDRGILATILVDVPEDVDAVAVVADAYAHSPWVRLRSPELRLVRGTAFADIDVHQRGPCVAVNVAIDNLGRGAAAQALQALAIAAGLPPLPHPIPLCP
ncbi:MAG: N-acetyl-gamma-glutamyl-phosphate reductase common form [Myxococcota bacterium]|jgi:N-acetyl-gamma-glutamyl-phosphate reductase common form